jgi:hypothetical protein
MLAATWTATSSRKRAQMCSQARTQWRVRDVGRGPCGRQREGGRGREGRTGADADGANGSVGADRSGRYGYVGADATAGIVKRAWTCLQRRL